MHCQRNANNKQIDGFSDFFETGLAQQLDYAESNILPMSTDRFGMGN